MRKILSLFFLNLVFASGAFAQAYKIDEFGKDNEEGLTLRMDNLSYALRNEPTAKGYIVIFGGKNEPFGFPIRLAERLRNDLKKRAALPNDRFEIITGGQIETHKTEIWIVPPGSNPPITESVYEQIATNKSFQFDDFDYPNPLDGQLCCSIGGYTKQEKKASLNKFAQRLKENKNLDAYLIVYGQYCLTCSEGLIYLDSQKVINRILRKEKDYLVKTHKIESSRIFTINGGYREWEAIELWVVPKGERPPKSTPKTFPRKRKS